MSFIGKKKKKACIDAQKSFTSFHWSAVKPCGPVCNNSWDGKCEEWQMSCCISPNWEGKQRGQVSGNGKKARMLGGSDTASIPSQKQDTKHRVFVFLSSKQKRSSSFTAIPETSPLTEGNSRSTAGVWCQRCGLMACPVSLSFMWLHKCEDRHHPGGGEQTWGDRLSVSEDTNYEQRNCQISRLSTSHTLFATGGSTLS